MESSRNGSDVTQKAGKIAELQNEIINCFPTKHLVFLYLFDSLQHFLSLIVQSYCLDQVIKFLS